MLARYYCMKPYYLLWLVMLVITGKIIFELLNANIEKTYKILINILFFTYVIGTVYTTLSGPCSFKIFEEQKETLTSMFNIYKLNRGIIMHENFEMIYTADELKVLEDVTKNFNNDTKIIYVEDTLNREWLRRILLIADNNVNQLYAPMDSMKKADAIKQYLLNTDEEVYVVCYKNAFIKLYFTELLDTLDNNLKLVAEKDNLVIYLNK